jgi:hypothetical protein
VDSKGNIVSAGDVSPQNDSSLYTAGPVDAHVGSA